MSALVWLRSDLRTLWHSPLSYAAKQHDNVSVVFFITPEQWQHYGLAESKLDLLIRRVLELRNELKEKGIILNIVAAQNFADIPEKLESLCQEYDIRHLYFNAEYELDERNRDKAVRAMLSEHDIECGVFHDTCTSRPDKILNQSSQPYKVFTPYFRIWLERLKSAIVPIPGIGQVSNSQTFSQSLANDADLVTAFLTHKSDGWPATEDEILQRLADFLDQDVTEYDALRDIPSEPGTSQLSPYFSMGVLSPVQTSNALVNRFGDTLFSAEGGAYTWLKELAWRDFYRYVMYHFPHVCRHQCFLTKYDNFAWQTDKDLFQAWCTGHTGYPIVDAAMRCLNQTGWMHNRLRMVVASFLTKHLRLPWRWGEDYFMSKLIDGDFASNNGGWQWSASVGTDAAPYFRIFNPASQGKRFDEEGEFLLKWVPELSFVPKKYLHEPQKWSGADSLDYPQPVVEHKQAVSDTKAQFADFLKN
ncbi:deoxyribodipyrimidine photo-lyase [Lacimicrobium alkaliphilum]|uniref:Deoxyribodipyrimidine photo-lyase n=1 Tax=Lacimicrobium alkaliphilum TaxID=1526571 RepID=A0ABQ1RSL6_9ALTE|nr:deoxyribodipyrimidine photo-lyase [Lacimicrobium alkaliphilum]GGD77974.1 deoxyribodipyrimidine photo-lyase [Lacimicrobium alkaliphilum]